MKKNTPRDSSDAQIKELLDCIHNLMGCFDTPIARRLINNPFADEARAIGRDTMQKYGRSSWQKEEQENVKEAL